MDIHGRWIGVLHIPQVWGQESVVSLQGVVGSLQEVLSGSGLSGTSGVAIFNTSEVEEFLGDWGSDNSYTLGSWNKPNLDRSGLSGHLAGNGMDVSDLVSPVSSSDWDNVELGNLQTVLDGNLHFLGNLDSQTDVSVLVSDSDDGLESGSLSSSSLLLDGHDLHDFVTEVLDEVVDDLVLLDWEGVGVDLFEGFDLSGFD